MFIYYLWCRIIKRFNIIIYRAQKVNTSFDSHLFAKLVWCACESLISLFGVLITTRHDFLQILLVRLLYAQYPEDGRKRRRNVGWSLKLYFFNPFVHTAYWANHCHNRKEQILCTTIKHIQQTCVPAATWEAEGKTAINIHGSCSYTIIATRHCTLLSHRQWARIWLSVI